jgi:hypothetical protein
VVLPEPPVERTPDLDDVRLPIDVLPPEPEELPAPNPGEESRQECGVAPPEQCCRMAWISSGFRALPLAFFDPFGFSTAPIDEYFR